MGPRWALLIPDHRARSSFEPHRDEDRAGTPIVTKPALRRERQALIEPTRPALETLRTRRRVHQILQSGNYETDQTAHGYIPLLESGFARVDARYFGGSAAASRCNAMTALSGKPFALRMPRPC